MWECIYSCKNVLEVFIHHLILSLPLREGMNKEGKLLTIPLYSIYFQNQTSTFQCWCILIIIHFRFLFFNISEIQDVTCEHSFQASVVVMIFTTIKKLNIIIYRKWCSEEIYGKVIVILRSGIWKWPQAAVPLTVCRPGWRAELFSVWF